MGSRSSEKQMRRSRQEKDKKRFIGICLLKVKLKNCLIILLFDMF